MVIIPVPEAHSVLLSLDATTETMNLSCTRCGACCAAFRVSFYWAESDRHPDGRVPQALTLQITPFHAAMRGTEKASPRCVALTGNIGQEVGCTIYAQRPSTCRGFVAGDARCIDARQRHGLPPEDAAA